MSSQKQPAECQQSDVHSGCDDEAPRVSPTWRQTPMGRWESEKIEEQPWNALGAVNIDSHWRETFATQGTCSTKGETGSSAGETK